MCQKTKRIGNETMWKPFLRQLLICTGVWTSYFVYGLSVGAPTVFIPQIRREYNSTEVISDDMASWLTSVIGFSGFPCVVILSVLTKFIGRKKCFVIASLDVFVAYVIYYFSSSVSQILISEIVQGLFCASQIVVSIVILTEYTSPRYRGLFLTLKSATFYWGVWASNAIGTFFHWKNIGVVGIILSIYTLMTVLIWPESPLWLASKGRYQECAISHRWLKGCDEESEKELANLIDTQKEYVKSFGNIKRSRIEACKDMYATMTSREFYKPTLISISTGMLSVCSGKIVCTVYAIDIIKNITTSESTAYTGMLILDGMTVISMYVGSFVSKIVRRRIFLLVSSSISVLFLFLLSLYLYLIHLSVITENKHVSVGLLILLSLSVGCGPLIMSTTVFGELIPIRSRNLAVCITALVGKLSVASVLKIAPYLFKGLGLHGVFLLFGISSIICILILYNYLPETKDKTLQEITDSMLGVKKNTGIVEEVVKLVPAVDNKVIVL